MPGELLRAYASAYDGAGNRLFWFAVPDRDGGNPTLVSLMINDELGVKDLIVLKQTRRELKVRVDTMHQELEKGLAFAEIDADYARWLIERAREVSRANFKKTPDGFLPIIARIGAPQQDYPAAPIYDRLPVAGLLSDPELPSDPNALFETLWFDPWFFEVERVVPWLGAWAVAQESPGTEEEASQEAREKVISETTEGLMPPALRVQYQRRLEESADVLARRGETAAARMALFHALALAENRPVIEIPFARAIARRTLEAALEMVRRSEAA